MKYEKVKSKKSFIDVRPYTFHLIPYTLHLYPPPYTSYLPPYSLHLPPFILYHSPHTIHLVYTNVASSVISVFNNLLIGQLAFASAAAAANFSASIPGMVAVTSK